MPKKDSKPEVLENPFSITIKGKPCRVLVETDPPWGEMQEVLNKSVVGDGTNRRFDVNNFFDLILETVIKEGLPFDPKNRTEMKTLKTSEMTKLIGEVIKRIPLGTYLDNLDMAGNQLGMVLQ